MPTEAHSVQTVSDGIHIIQAYDHASAAARTGASYSTTDEGKVSRQTDNDSWWVVSDSTGPSFIQITDDMGGDVSGKQGSATVTALQGRNVQDHAPVDGEALVWVASNNRWEPTVVSGSDVAVEVSGNDTTPGDLETKLIAGSGITMTTQNDGGNETRTVAAKRIAHIQFPFHINSASTNWISFDSSGPYLDSTWAFTAGNGGAASGDPSVANYVLAAPHAPFDGVVTSVQIFIDAAVAYTTTPIYFAFSIVRADWGNDAQLSSTLLTSRTDLQQPVGPDFYSNVDALDATSTARLTFNTGSSQDTVEAGDCFYPTLSSNGTANNARGTISITVEES